MELDVAHDLEETPHVLYRSLSPLSSLSSPPPSRVLHTPQPPPPPLPIQFTRYSLRARNAKQLNPYAYDKLLYQQQMRSHPDAIVRVLSPKKRADRPKRAASEGVELDVELGEEDDAAFIYPWKRRNRGGFARALSEDVHRAQDREGVRLDPVNRRILSQGVWTHFGTVPSEDGAEEEVTPTQGDAVSDVEMAETLAESLGQDVKLEEDPLQGFDIEMVEQSQAEEAPLGSPPRPPSEHMDLADDQQLDSQTQSPKRRVRFGRAVAEDTDQDGDDETEPDSHSTSSSEQDIKGLRELRKVWPAVMINKYLKGGLSTQPKRAAPVNRHSDDEDAPLQPGETRVRKALYSPSTRRDIKGDSESSDELSDSLFELAGPPSSEGTADVTSPVVGRISRRKSVNTVPILISSSEEEGTSSGDDDVGDTEISAWLEQEPVPRYTRHRSSLPREDLIDWMLTRTRTVGANPNRVRRKPAKSKARWRPRLQVVTGGAEKVLAGRQTLLPFEHAKARRRSSGNRDGHIRRRSSPPDVTFDTGDVQIIEDPKPQERKKKRVRSQAHLHVFPSKGTRISTGRRKKATLTVNVGDEGFRKALAPLPVRPSDDHSTPKSRFSNSSMFSGPLDAYMVNAEADAVHSGPSHLPAQYCEIKPDFDIPFLPSGIAFRVDTYLGKGWLYELVTVLSDASNVIPPFSYAAYGLELSCEMSIPQFSVSLALICDRLLEFASSPADNHAEDLKRWENVMHIACQMVSWLPTKADPEHILLLQTAVREQVLRLITRIEEREDYLEDVVFTIYWFTIELSARLAYTFPREADLPAADTEVLVQCIVQALQRLLEYGLQKTMVPIQTSEDGLDALAAPQRSAELWICLFHLLDHSQVSFSSSVAVAEHVHPLWRVVQQVLQQPKGVQQPGLEPSEAIWRAIFSLCALTQFSVHGMVTSTCRIGAAWELVTVALTQIRLGAELEKDHACSERVLDQRDAYIGVIVSRCFILWNRWRWDLGHASCMFHQLAEIFRSRSFANLRREPSDFPSFMRECDFGLLSQYKTGDTAFELFLKLIVQAAKGDSDNAGGRVGVGLTPKLKKILSLAMPVGSVPFTKAKPPTVHELSMLYNRISAVAITVYLDSTPSNVHFRLGHARGFADFKNADETTRVACIRGAMYFGILMRHRRVPLGEVASWFAQMANVLVEEFGEAATGGDRLANMAKDRVTFSVQILLGSARFILETQLQDPTRESAEYPDPALLDESWLADILSNRTSLANMVRTGIEIRRLVQTFLNARAAVLPLPDVHCVTPAPSGETEESQDEYGALELDLNDPELLAALGDEPLSGDVIKMREKDARVSRVVDVHVFPAIHRLMCKFFNDSSSKVKFREYCHDADQWIDCWIGCAHVAVQNHIRDWSRFLNLGPQCWETVSRRSWRQRAGVRFASMLLRHDPKIYLTHTSYFMQVFFESLVTARVTLEHEYASLLFVVDGLRHTLLRGISCVPDPVGNEKFEISASRFLDLRLDVIREVFKGVEESLRGEKKGDVWLTVQNQMGIGLFINMFSMMEATKRELVADDEMCVPYVDFCKSIFALMVPCVELSSEPRLASWIDWGRSL